MSETTTPTTSAQPGTMRMSEALESLDGYAVTGIEDHWGRDLDQLSGMRLTIGVIAMLLKRSGMSTKDAWQRAKSMNLRDLNAWFAPEPEVETDEQDEPGKG